jgi:hypothetical protein
MMLSGLDAGRQPRSAGGGGGGAKGVNPGNGVSGGKAIGGDTGILVSRTGVTGLMSGMGLGSRGVGRAGF